MTVSQSLPDDGRESQSEFSPPPDPQKIVTGQELSDSSQATRATRRRLPDERCSLTHHFSVAGQEGYLTVGVYEDGRPCELFIRMAKEGSTISGLMDAFATAVSLALQHGVPLEVMCSKFTHMRFEPSGWSGNPKIGYAKSLIDYIFRWLEIKFLNREQGELFQFPRAAPDAQDKSEPRLGNEISSETVEPRAKGTNILSGPQDRACG